MRGEGHAHVDRIGEIPLCSVRMEPAGKGVTGLRDHRLGQKAALGNRHRGSRFVVVRIKGHVDRLGVGDVTICVTAVTAGIGERLIVTDDRAGARDDQLAAGNREALAQRQLLAIQEKPNVSLKGDGGIEDRRSKQLDRGIEPAIVCCTLNMIAASFGKRRGEIGKGLYLSRVLAGGIQDLRGILRSRRRYHAAAAKALRLSRGRRGQVDLQRSQVLKPLAAALGRHGFRAGRRLLFASLSLFCILIVFDRVLGIAVFDDDILIAVVSERDAAGESDRETHRQRKNKRKNAF